jgi:predicted transposase YbfD/YdcC
LTVVVTAAVCAVVAGYRSYTAIAEWVADLPDGTAELLGIDTARRPSEAMIRRLLQALDPDRLTAVIGIWLAAGTPTAATTRAIAVDGKTLRGSRTTDTAARHVLAAADQDSGVVLASIDVDGHTNEITRFGPLLDQIGDLRNTVITADALHCQREHTAYLAERGADWILTVKGNQPRLHTQLAGLPWRAVPEATRADDRGHGRRETRTLKILTTQTPGSSSRTPPRPADPPPQTPPRPAQAVHHRNRLRHHQPARPPGKPAQLAAWNRRHWHIENQLHWVRDVTYDEDRSNRYHARDSNRPLALLGIT